MTTSLAASQRWFRRLKRAVVALTVIATAVPAAAPMAAAAADKPEISFRIAHVEDRYALNLPVFREMFRLLDIGYAGCSVGLAVSSAGAEIPPGANPKIEVSYTVERGPKKPPYTSRAIGSVARRSVIIYLNQKCAEITKIKIGGAGCFSGFENQWRDLSCPYKFRVTGFSIPEFYDWDR
jgi:hypothetical protein